MRRIYGWMAGCALLIALVGGCGSTDDGDELILRVVQFHGMGIEQADSVSANSASVDVSQGFCRATGGGMGEVMISLEVFTPTLINAVLRNDQRLDVLLDRMVIHFEDQRVGFGDITQSISGTVRGGRCSNAQDRSCAVNSECVVGATTGVCVFSETTISGLLLIDLAAKAAVWPQILGQGTPAQITFYGSDVVGNKYRGTGGFTVLFDDFCNCAMGELCCSSLAQCGAVTGDS
jgi:hypothetical protein